MGETDSRFRRAMEARGLEPPDVARQLGVTRNAVHLWLRGESTPGGPAKRLLAGLLFVSLDEVESWFPERTTEPATAGVQQ